MAGDAQTEEKTTPTFATKATQFVDKLTILQRNADALLSNIEELRGYIEEKDIDIFMIQETKLISTDIDIEKKFPGFTVKRQDRPQKIGCERNRGGGVMVGIKKSIPFRIV
jgi:exonuclease III